MFPSAQQHASSSYLHPITPPHPFYDDAAIVHHHENDFHGHHTMSSPPSHLRTYEDGSSHSERSCAQYPPATYPSSTSPSAYSHLAPPSLLAMPSPLDPFGAPGPSRLPPLEPDYGPAEEVTRSSLDISTPALVLDEGGDEFVSNGKMDMGMAEVGTEAAQPGYQTSLAAYAAQMVVWLWFGQQSQPQPLHMSPNAHTKTLLNSPNPFDFSHPSPINPLQITPSAEFSSFVNRLLKVTMVSHSVTLLALLYIYRLKTNNRCIVGHLGSETRPFVVSLILGNKYLDDNTYTNSTWAELAGIPLKELNTMEAEFLHGLGYSLSVEKSEYTHWRNLLDGFIYARQQAAHNAALNRHRPSWSPQSIIYTPTGVNIPQLPDQIHYRARSASPIPVYTPPGYHPVTAYHHDPSPSRLKRTAGTAFASEFPTSAQVYESMRMPPRKAHFGSGSMDASAGYSMPVESQGSSLVRSSSLSRQSRQIARLPGENGRRGSMGHLYGVTPAASEMDLRHAAAMQWQNEEQPRASRPSLRQTQRPVTGWPGPTALMAAYDGSAQPTHVPPEHLMFYALAAEAHPGYDGAPRKAILRYQHPGTAQSAQAAQNSHTAMPTPQSTYPAYVPDDPITYADAPYPPSSTYGYAVPQPANFANAGPPGYAYDPSTSSSSSTRPSRSTKPTGLGISGVSTSAQGGGGGSQWAEGYSLDGTNGNHPVNMWKARSQWSSPAFGRVDPRAWQQI